MNWQQYGACRDSNPDLFFPVRSGNQALVDVRAAKRICAACPVIGACLRYALTEPETYGVWGGTTPLERRAIRRRRRLRGAA